MLYFTKRRGLEIKLDLQLTITMTISLLQISGPWAAFVLTNLMDDLIQHDFFSKLVILGL